MYGFSISSDKPGSFDLVFMHHQGRVKSETVTVQSDGFLFRMRKFRDVDSLLRFFKEDESKTLQKKIRDSGARPPGRPDQSQSRPRQREGARDSRDPNRDSRDPNRDSRDPNRDGRGGMHPSRAAMVDNSRL